MAQILILSKNRPFQLYLTLESLYKTFVDMKENKHEIVVYYKATTDKFVEGYIKLFNLFKNVIFYPQKSDKIDWKDLLIILKSNYANSRGSDFVHIGVDDAFYQYGPVKFQDLVDDFNGELCGKYTLFLNKEWYKEDTFIKTTKLSCFYKRKFDENNNKIIPKTNLITALDRPFGVGSAIFKTKDVIELLEFSKTNIYSPWTFESEGVHYFDNKFTHIQMTKLPYNREIHFNNFLKRYPETFTDEWLLDLFLNKNKVIDYDTICWEKIPVPTDWMNDKPIAGFPEFPCDIGRAWHEEIIKTLRDI